MELEKSKTKFIFTGAGLNNVITENKKLQAENNSLKRKCFNEVISSS